ncbi:MAG: SIS domain-containing protein, partial [Rhodobacteraceae bacterium]|nr:SIS domain-containing protein [Paracoccaceae bacterium]
LPGTYGVDPDRILILMAGGLPRDSRMPGDTEDDAEEAARAAQAIRAGDLVIAVAASGATPYPMSIAREGRARGAPVLAIAHTPAAPIFELADVAVCLPTPPEATPWSTPPGPRTA